MCLTFSALVRPKSKQRLLVDFKICVVELTVLWNCASKVICSLGNFAAFCSRCKAVAKKGTTTVLKVVVCSRLTGFILGLHQKPVMQHNAITRHELWSHWPVNVGDYYLGRAPRWSQRGCNGWEWTCDMHIYIYISCSKTNSPTAQFNMRCKHMQSWWVKILQILPRSSWCFPFSRQIWWPTTTKSSGHRGWRDSNKSIRTHSIWFATIQLFLWDQRKLLLFEIISYCLDSFSVQRSCPRRWYLEWCERNHLGEAVYLGINSCCWYVFLNEYILLSWDLLKIYW